MDKKSEILDRAARMAIIRSGVEKNANLFTKAKNFFKSPIKTKNVQKRVPGEMFKSHDGGLATKIVDKKEDIDPIEGWTPMKLLGIVAAGVITNQFIQRLISAGERAGIKMKSPAYYQLMLKEHPQIMEMDEEKVLKLWKTLYNTAPHLAQDPVAAGGFIIQSIDGGLIEDYGAPSIDTYKTLVGIEGDIRENRDSGAANAFGSVATALSAGAIS
jgi:hypothetical protein